MDFPEVFFFEDDPTDEARGAEVFAQVVRDLGIENPFVVASPHGDRLASKVEGPRAPERPAAADQKWAADVGSRAHRSGADAIVAVGGGRCLDIAKLAAARSGLQIIVAPTQLSHDGICSPVAVVPNEEGRTESIGAITPRAAFISMPTLLGAPAQSVAAGIGDLLANPLALRDWALAAEHGLEEIDQRAWDLSTQSFELIEPRLDSDPQTLTKDPEFLRLLADALVQSGMSMICSGTSRPASGGEHEISHAMDELFGGRAMHGEQVAFGCIISVALYEEDTTLFRKRLRGLGLPQEPADLQLSTDELIRVLLEAPETRPGRFTILEETDLDEAGARALVDRIWGGGL
ncbi:MAG: glycerol-phosphate dehydrogenase [Actinomycetota bacterium]|nr:glycerol-phosphate dehydrogenase [Actinomycetota bacterium]